LSEKTLEERPHLPQPRHDSSPLLVGLPVDEAFPVVLQTHQGRGGGSPTAHQNGLAAAFELVEHLAEGLTKLQGVHGFHFCRQHHTCTVGCQVHGVPASGCTARRLEYFSRTFQADRESRGPSMAVSTALGGYPCSRMEP